MSSLNKQVYSGVQWITLSTITLVITQMVSTAVLVRLLDKSDFGLMALVMVVKGFADIFMDFGITVAILHKQDMSQNQYSSLYWLNMFAGIIFYHEIALLKLIPLMCLAIPFSSIGRQQKTLLQKELYFRAIAVVDIISALMGLCAAFYFAYTGWGVYALVFSNLARYTVGNIIYFFVGVKIVPIKLHFKLSETLSSLKIGGYHTVSQVINYFTGSFDVLIIGKLLGAEGLGIYNLAKDLVTKPSALVAPIASKVATPIFSKMQDDSEQMNRSFFSVQKIVSYLNGFVYLGVFALAEPFVAFYYGEKYLVCVPLIHVLAIYYFIRQYGDTIGMVCIAKGRTDIDMWWNIIVVCFTPFVLWIGAQYSILVVTFALLLSQLVLTYPGWYMYSNKLLGIPFIRYYNNFLKTVGVFILPIIVSLLLIRFLSFPAIVVFLITGAVFTVITFVLLLVFENSLVNKIVRR